MKRCVLFNLMFVFALCSISIQAQTPAKQVAKPVARLATKPVATNPNNKELIELAQGGASERNLLGAVAAAKAEGRTYGKSAKEILALTKAGVSDTVIEAIRAIGTPTTASVQPTVPASVVVNIPSTQHVGVSLEQPSTVSLDGREAGIYFDNKGNLEQLEPAVYSGASTGHKFLNSYVSGLFTSSVNGVVRSPAANQRIQNSMPTFYFFFEVKGAGLSGGSIVESMNMASSPNEFLLVKLKVNKNERQIALSKTSNIRDRSGVDSKDIADFSIKKLRPGVYEVKPRNPLPPGEYCFFYQGGAASSGGVGKLFDFGIDPDASVQ